MVEEHGHFKFKQNAISRVEFQKSAAELIPCQSRRVGLSQLRWDLHFARRIFREEVLIDCLGKDVPELSTHLQHSVLGSCCGQLVEMKLQAELIEVGQRNVSERLDEIALNENRLRLGCLLFPGSLFQR